MTDRFLLSLTIINYSSSFNSINYLCVLLFFASINVSFENNLLSIFTYYIHHINTQKLIIQKYQLRYAIQYVDEKQINSTCLSPGVSFDKLCIMAVKQNGLALRYVQKQFKTQEICDIAVNQNRNAQNYFD